MKAIVCVFLLALTLAAAQAQDSACGQWKPRARRMVCLCPDKVWDKQFTAYTAALWAATVLDVESTRSPLDNCREGNPILGDKPEPGHDVCSDGSGECRHDVVFVPDEEARH